MERKKELEISKQLFMIYTKSETQKEFNEELKKFIDENKIKKTTLYIRNLLDEYKKRIQKGTIEYEIMQNTKEILRQSGNYKEVVEKLIKMSDEELEKYMINNKPWPLKTKFEKYISTTNSKEQLELAKTTMKKIEKIHETKMDKKKNIAEQERFETSKKILDAMVNNGFFDYGYFQEQMHEKFNCTTIELERLVTRSKTYFKEKYPDLFKKYIIKIKKNKIKYYIFHKKKIIHLLQNAPMNYDIIDYYIDFRLPVRVFIDLYKSLYDMKIINNSTRTKLGLFFDIYYDEMHNAMRHNSLEIENSELRYKEEIINSEEKEKILEFMNKYDIPRNYFLNCYRKYKKGELDKYINNKVKSKA